MRNRCENEISIMSTPQAGAAVPNGALSHLLEMPVELLAEVGSLTLSHRDILTTMVV